MRFLQREEATLGISHEYVSESEIQSNKFCDLDRNVFGSMRETGLHCVSGKSGDSFSSAGTVYGNTRETYISVHTS